ncbi:type II toxin-antitoxin system RelE/ParE family toxin [Neisseria dentiae]|uniref:type II toxin-antitoxin system RelE/ParE family toxin n=1 Tax=Neisseria dentiae TaxID=194197 RepID=UPI0035A1CDD7
MRGSCNAWKGISGFWFSDGIVCCSVILIPKIDDEFRQMHSVAIQKRQLQLTALNNAVSPQDMNAPSWRLHQLSGSLKDHWSITVNGNWRLTFRFENGHAEVVDYQDYH